MRELSLGPGLFWSFCQEVDSDGGENDVGQPAGEEWRDDTRDGEDPEKLED